MPKQIKDIKKFLQIAKSDETASKKENPNKPRVQKKKVLFIKNSKKITKFKLRGSKYLYTYIVDDKDKAAKLTQSLPPGLQKIEIKTRKLQARKKKNK